MSIESTRRPKNEAEAEFYDWAKSRGWQLTRRGWPDFFCWRDGQIALVEVKPKKGRRLKQHQIFVLKALAEAGTEGRGAALGWGLMVGYGFGGAQVVESLSYLCSLTPGRAGQGMLYCICRAAALTMTGGEKEVRGGSVGVQFGGVRGAARLRWDGEGVLSHM
jgi:hypothetical protein